MATAAWLRGAPIGRGATATVSLAAASAGTIFAVKSAPLSRSALLQREQSILSSFSSPSILSCLGFDITSEPSGALFYNLFLEYAAGGSLADQIKRRGGRLSEAEIRSFARDILVGLSHLHNAGVVHCDVKPGNVLIGSCGRAKVGDLGCARRIAAGERKEIKGSPMYMAPEAVRGEEQGTPADLWSFGCTVIEMATGRPPWADVVDVGEGIRRIGFSGQVPAIPDWFSDEVRDFVRNCLRRDPRERWTAEELLRHPFLECSRSGSSCGDLSWGSPKSTLDRRLWEFGEEEEVDDEEEFADEVVAGRIILELALGSGGPNWTWDGDWVDVRNVAGECAAETEVSELLIVDEAAGTSGNEEFVFGGDILWNESCECCGWGDGDCELICLCCKMGIFDNGDGHSFGLSNWFFASFISWHFAFGLFMLFHSCFGWFIVVYAFVWVYAKWMEYGSIHA